MDQVIQDCFVLIEINLCAINLFVSKTEKFSNLKKF